VQCVRLCVFCRASLTQGVVCLLCVSSGALGWWAWRPSPWLSGWSPSPSVPRGWTSWTESTGAWRTSKIENALQKIEGKLGASFSSPPARVVRDARKAINQLQSGSKLVGDGAAAEPLHRMPGEEWTGQDQHHYDTNMAEAVGEDGTTAYDGMKLPPSFMPISGTLHYLVSFAPD
jgi:hypothetical protein